MAPIPNMPCNSRQDAERCPVAQCLIPILIVGLGLLLRLVGITEYWLNPDEGIYYDIAHTPEVGTAVNAVLGNVHPPLFHMVLRCMAHFGGGILWLRLPSLVFACVSIWGLYLLGKRLGGGIVGAAAALLLALSPAGITLSRVARPYAMQMASTVFCLWFLAGFCKSPGRRDLVGYALCMTLALLTHYSSCVLLGACLGLLVVVAATGHWTRRTFWRVAIAHVPVVLIAVLLFFLHLRPHVLGSEIQTEARDGWLDAFFVQSPYAAWNGFAGIFFYGFGDRYGGAAALAFVIGLGAAAAHRKHLIYAIPALAIGLGLFLSSLRLLPFGGSRHSIYLLPLVVLPMAYAARLYEPLKRRWAIATAMGILLVVPLPVGLILSGKEAIVSRQPEIVLKKEGYEAIERVLETVQESGELLLLDLQTHYLLVPRFHEGEPCTGPHWHESFYWRQWGKSMVIVSKAWTMAGPTPSEERQRFLALISAVDVELPEVGIRDRASVWVIMGGWCASTLFGSGKGGDQFVRRQVRVPGCEAFEVNMNGFAGSATEAVRRTR